MLRQESVRINVLCTALTSPRDDSQTPTRYALDASGGFNQGREDKFFTAEQGHGDGSLIVAPCARALPERPVLEASRGCGGVRGAQKALSTQ